MDRIASFNNSNSLIKNLMKVEAAIAVAQTQEATELKSTDYAGLSSSTSTLISLEAYYARSERYVDEGNTVSSRIETMSDAVGDMLDTITNFKAIITSLQGTGSEAAETYPEQAQTYLEEFAASMNTQYDGSYVFSGGATDSAAIDVSTYVAKTYPSSVDTSYYSGDDTVASIRADDDQVIEYGVTGNTSGMEKALRAMSLLANMSTDPVDDDLVNEAYDLANEAFDELTTTQTSLGAKGATLDNTIDRHLDEQLTIQSQVEDVKNVDLAEAETRLSQLEALMSANASAIKALSAFNLNDLL